MADKNRVWLRQKAFDDLGQDAGWCNVDSYELAPPSREATLVVHKGKSERLFTASEVQAILHDLRSWISPDDGEEGRMWETRAKLHGIVLDPA